MVHEPPFNVPGTHLKTFKDPAPTSTHFFSLYKITAKIVNNTVSSWKQLFWQLQFEFHSNETSFVTVGSLNAAKVLKNWSELSTKFSSMTMSGSLSHYHFLTRSTESITLLTSSLARLRVSNRKTPLLFIMAAKCRRNVPDVTRIFQIRKLSLVSSCPGRSPAARL